MTSAIVVTDLGKTISVGFWGRKKTLVSGVSFSVEPGVTLGFVGPNGAGKSTTIKHLVGGSRPTQGSVRIFGGDPRDPKVRLRFGYMPELPYLPPTLTPREMLKLHATLCSVAPGKRIDELLTLVGLEANADQRVGGFSKGMQTRLSLALALVHEPDLLVLDEPMSGLDPVGRQLVRRILLEQSAAGRTVFFSSHVLSDVEALCDQVAVIKGGKLVYAGATDDAVGTATDRWSVRVRTKDGNAPAGVHDAKREGETWLVVVAASDGVDAALAMRSAGHRVLSLEPLRPSLEERLVGLLGGSTS